MTFPGRMVADPFMGGGTPLLEANRVGCDVQGFDINPMAAWIVREEIEHLDLVAYREAADALVEALEQDVGASYRTDCPLYGDRDVPVKYFLWIKVLDCEKCGKEFDLFPGYLLAEDSRHPKNVLVCSKCGDLNDVANLGHPRRMLFLPSRTNRDRPRKAQPVCLPCLWPREHLSARRIRTSQAPDVRH